MTTHRPRQGPAEATALVVALTPHACTHNDRAWTGTEAIITELTAAFGHLESALALGRTPARFLLPNGATVTAAQLRLWVAQHTSRVQALLDQITAPYTNSPT